jgi:hypothetical protein
VVYFSKSKTGLLLEERRQIPPWLFLHGGIRVLVSEKVSGPQSYFPSIEAKYGHPVTHWFMVLEAQVQLTHMEMVALLKADHGVGHGHANALVAYFRGATQH